MSTPVEFHAEGGVATLRMTRADKKNALTLAMYEAMTGHIESVNGDAEIRCLKIMGSSGAFCAGNDVEDFLKFASAGGLGAPIIRFLKALVQLKKPVIAGVDGPAIGVGSTMLLHCDYVIAADRAVFATPFVDLGLVPEAGSSLIGPRLMGQARAFEFFAMGRRWNAERAAAAGLVNEIVAHDALEEAASAVARGIAAKPIEALAITRALLRGDQAGILARIDEEAKLFEARLKSPEAMQAFMMFLSRKKA